jgi:hypothetical protein
LALSVKGQAAHGDAMLASALYVVLLIVFFVTVALGARPRHERLPVRVVLRTGVLRLAWRGVLRLTELASCPPDSGADVETGRSAPSPG